MKNVRIASNKLLTTSEAAQNLKISAAQLRRLLRDFGTVPSGQWEVKTRKYSQTCPLWSRKDIGVIKRTNKYKKCRSRAEKIQANNELLAIQRRPGLIELIAKHEAFVAARKREWQWRISLLTNTYGQPENALADACHTMQQLNRMTKHRSTPRSLRDSIYEVKNRLIRHLFQIGKTEGIAEHFRYHCSDWSNQKKTFVCFSFRIGKDLYEWHQPKDLVDWQYEATGPSAEIASSPAKPYDFVSCNLDTALTMILYAISELDSATTCNLSLPTIARARLTSESLSSMPA